MPATENETKAAIATAPPNSGRWRHLRRSRLVLPSLGLSALALWAVALALEIAHIRADGDEYHLLVVLALLAGFVLVLLGGFAAQRAVIQREQAAEAASHGR